MVLGVVLVVSPLLPVMSKTSYFGWEVAVAHTYFFINTVLVLHISLFTI